MKKVGNIFRLVPWRITLCVAAACLGLLFVVRTVRHAQALSSCPCHIIPSTDTPADPSYNDSSPEEFGVRFKTQVNGYITGVRFYKDASMTDTHVGHLWGPTGSLLASATFTAETSSGWQDVLFSTPVQVTAGTIYTASFYTPAGRYMATHNYFASDVSNYPLTAPTAGGNGVFTSGDNYPTNSYQSSSYWVDVNFRASADGSAPQVSDSTPTNGATNVFTGSSLTATFSHAMDGSTITTSNVALTDAGGNPVSVAVSYDDSTFMTTITPSQALDQNASYTLSIHGGAGGVTDLDGNPLATDYQTAFTTGTDTCPCSIWNRGAPTNTPLTYGSGVSGGESFGTTIKSDENGYIHAIRFFKPLKSTVTTGTVGVWSTSGTLLGSGTVTHETSSGWQEAQLSAPVQIQQNTNYIISYYTADTIHTYTLGGLSTQVDSGPLHAVAHGGWYHPGGDAFPDNQGGSDTDSNAWIDAVFSTSSTYTAPFNVRVSQPTAGGYGVKPSDPVTFTLSNAADSTTVAGSVGLKDASGATVAGTTTYDDTQHTITFQPSSPLARNQHYTASLSAGLHDVYGTPLTAYTLSFTTGSALSTDITQGLGGPVLVLTSASDAYGDYLAEMLRAEGINYYTVKDISQISTGTLGQYRLVLLAKASLSAGQVTTLSDWVHGGGNLIAMQPDKQLAGLLGVTDQNQTLSEGYLRVDTSTEPGNGVTAETMQYHGSADEYSANSGTQVVATLFSDATTTTSSPAITEASVGSGHAAAFTYDLPKSIALTHQGNPAWAGQERDSNSPIRPDDLFDGNGSTDWLNLSKAHIPQADEQQQLLVNMMLTMDAQNTPLPRFWILPHGLKAALVMTEDDHATATTTFDIFNDMVTVSAKDCSVVDWQCSRSGSLLYTASGLTLSQATLAQSLGFSMGVHVQTACGNYLNYSDLASTYASQIAAFQAKYTSIVPQIFDRTHCYVWSDWDSVPKVDVANGMRINYNYEWYPPTWTGSNTGYLTGSGLEMRFTDASGNLLDNYQGVTDLDYETDPTSTTMNADFDNMTNSNAFYGVLGTHYDTSGSNYYQLLMAAAQAHNMPMISAAQLATWKDALGSSTFTNVSSSPSQLTFTADVAQGGEGMQAMIPASSGNGALTSLQVDGSSVTYSASTVKGVAYAVFDAQPGTYTAVYGTPANNTGGGTGTGGTTNSNAGTSVTSRSATSSKPKTVGATGTTSAPATASITTPNPFTNHNTVSNGSSQNKDIVTKAGGEQGSTLPVAWILTVCAGSLIIVGAGTWWIVSARRKRGF